MGKPIVVSYMFVITVPSIEVSNGKARPKKYDSEQFHTPCKWFKKEAAILFLLQQSNGNVLFVINHNNNSSCWYGCKLKSFGYSFPETE